MHILIIDGQGGKIGKLLIEGVREKLPQAEITAIGTNSIATTNMLKAGPDQAATGANPVMVASGTADVIAGPIGIVIADALVGEITAEMAVAVGRSRAKKVLIPLNKCDNVVAGVMPLSMSELVSQAIEQIVNSSVC
ncbi:MAG: DUF3842 family protein [Lachnospiraceae bacterium]|nr:DUF3842 family protein [Lachnospiraceae bacterium]